MVESIQRVIIAGNSPSALLAATILAANIKSIQILLIDAVEPSLNSPVESSSVNIKTVLGLLGINEEEFMVNTQATFKLGNQFLNWNDNTSDFIHAFGAYGVKLDVDEFVQSAVALQHSGYLLPVENFSIAAMAVRHDRYPSQDLPSQKHLPPLLYGMHFNSHIFAGILSVCTRQMGIKRIAEKISRVMLTDDGAIDYLQVESGEQYSADLYIDCTEHSALLMNALKIQYQDWSDELTVDRSYVAVVDSADVSFVTKIQATDTGVVRYIPLQNLGVYEFFYCSKITPDHKALAEFKSILPGARTQTSPLLEFKPGRRVKLWEKNCIGIGRAAIDLPGGVYSSTFLTLAVATHLLDYFPAKEINQPLINEFNRITLNELDRLRDYHALHYYLLRDAHPLKIKNIKSSMPALDYKLRIFNASARLPWFDDEVADRQQWESLLMGMGIWPKRRNPLFNPEAIDNLYKLSVQLKQNIFDVVQSMPTRNEYLSRRNTLKK